MAPGRQQAEERHRAEASSGAKPGCVTSQLWDLEPAPPQSQPWCLCFRMKSGAWCLSRTARHGVYNLGEWHTAALNHSGRQHWCELSQWCQAIVCLKLWVLNSWNPH